MDKETIEKNLTNALEFYNSGKYAEASQLWKEILAADPANKQAQEGVKMAELLSQQWIDDDSETAGLLKGMREETSSQPLPTTMPVKTQERKSAIAEREAAIEKETQVEQTLTVEEHRPEEKQPDAKAESEMRVSFESKAKMLVAEGEDLMQSGKYGEAIDRFSRALVMDESDHRIQQLLNTARGMLEKEQQEFEKKLHSAIELFDKGDYDSSEKLFNDILKANPSHNDALFYIDKLKKAKDEIKNIQAIGVEQGDGKKQGDAAKKPAGAKTAEEGPIQIAKQPRERIRTMRETPGPSLIVRRSLTTKIILIVAPVLFLVGGFYLTRYAIERFSLRGAGNDVKTEQIAAAGVGQGIVPAQGSSQQDAAGQASALIGGMTVKKGNAGQMEQEASSRSLENISVSNLIKDGKDYLKAGRPIEAEKRFRQATILDPVNIEAKQLLEETSKLADEDRKYLDRKSAAIQNFNDGEFTEALRIFYRLPEKKREPIVTSYIMNSWYNLGVTYLQAGNIVDAKNAFDEVLSVDPSDSGAKKEKELAEWYITHKIDSTFVAHVENLKLRRIDH